MDRQLEFERWRRRRLPQLTDPMRVMLRAIDLAGGDGLSAGNFRRPGGQAWHCVFGKGHGARVLRRLLALGLIEVMGVSPARYRVTRLGRLTVGLRG